MKRILLTLCLVLCTLPALCGNGRFEIGAGLARPGYLLYGDRIDWNNSGMAFVAYHQRIIGGLSLGAEYLFAPSYSSSEDLSSSSIYQRLRSYSHSFNIQAEYPFRRREDVSPFISVGMGPQLSSIGHFLSDLLSPGLGLSWLADYHIQAGVEITNTFRIAVGQMQENSLLRSSDGYNVPAWYISVSLIL